MNISRLEVNCPVFGLVQDVKVTVCFINLETQVGNTTWECQWMDSTETQENG